MPYLHNFMKFNHHTGILKPNRLFRSEATEALFRHLTIIDILKSSESVFKYRKIVQIQVPGENTN